VSRRGKNDYTEQKGGRMLIRNRYSDDLDWIKGVHLEKQVPYYSTSRGAAYQIDALKVLEQIPPNSVDLIMTSPPFALTRKKEYGNEPIERYFDWFLDFSRQFHRILKDSGSFVLDIGGSWIPGAPTRSLYHFDLAVRLVNSGEWFLAQEFYHFNPAKLPTPAEWVTVKRVRVKDAVNMVWWFSKTKHPKANNKKILRPYSDSMKSLLVNGYEAKDRPSGHKISKKFNRDNGGAIPSNVIQIANTESNSSYLRMCRESGIKPHPARYPETLVEFFLNFVTEEGDLVVDPFAGSNVTGAVCEVMDRRWLACDESREYLEGSVSRFGEHPQPVIKHESNGVATGS